MLTSKALTFKPSLRALATSRRTYALSRHAERPIGTSRSRSTPSNRTADSVHPKQFQNIPREEEASEDVSRLWHTSQRPPASDPEEGLHALLMTHKALVVERQIEMLNIFVGFEQCNKYTITNEAKEIVGYIAEESKDFLSTISRQAFATHRPFRAVIMDAAGFPILWLRRPFAWINSRMYVQRLQNPHKYTQKGEPILDTFGEVQQIWHLWRRCYDVFLREDFKRVLSLAHEAQPEPEPELAYNQFAKVDAGPLAWYFPLRSRNGGKLAFIHREFRGFGREILTDTGRYTVGFTPDDSYSESDRNPSRASRDLSIDERAVTLALAVNIDFDYFSHHSHAGSGGIFHVANWGD